MHWRGHTFSRLSALAQAPVQKKAKMGWRYLDSALFELALELLDGTWWDSERVSSHVHTHKTLLRIPTELRGAHGRVVCGVREQDRPAENNTERETRQADGRALSSVYPGFASH
jgi:hypothetical protein